MSFNINTHNFLLASVFLPRRFDGYPQVSFCTSAGTHRSRPFRVCHGRRWEAASTGRGAETSVRRKASGRYERKFGSTGAATSWLDCGPTPTCCTLASSTGKSSQGAGCAFSIPPGIDPGVARQALQSGVTPEALAEIAKVLNIGQTGRGVWFVQLGLRRQRLFCPARRNRRRRRPEMGLKTLSRRRSSILSPSWQPRRRPRRTGPWKVC